nr:uncharacterized protein LOC113398712 [Vanessa tameamea]
MFAKKFTTEYIHKSTYFYLATGEFSDFIIEILLLFGKVKPRSDHVRNSYIRGSLGVRDVSGQAPRARLRWYGDIACRPKDYVGRKCPDIFVPGSRPHGRPRKQWLVIVKQDMRANGLPQNDAKDRAKWTRR